jgi:hypothetical protein
VFRCLDPAGPSEGVKPPTCRRPSVTHVRGDGLGFRVCFPRYGKSMKIMMSLSQRRAARCRRSRAMIIPRIIESGLSHIGLCAIPAVPELGRNGKRKTPSLWSSKAPTRSPYTFFRDISRSSRREYLTQTRNSRLLRLALCVVG